MLNNWKSQRVEWNKKCLRNGGRARSQEKRNRRLSESGTVKLTVCWVLAAGFSRCFLLLPFCCTATAIAAQPAQPLSPWRRFLFLLSLVFVFLFRKNFLATYFQLGSRPSITTLFTKKAKQSFNCFDVGNACTSPPIAMAWRNSWLTFLKKKYSFSSLSSCIMFVFYFPWTVYFYDKNNINSRK